MAYEFAGWGYPGVEYRRRGVALQGFLQWAVRVTDVLQGSRSKRTREIARLGRIVFGKRADAKSCLTSPFKVVERGEMTFKFSSVRSALVLGTSTRSGRTRRHHILPLPLPHDTLTGTRGRHDELADPEQAERSTELPVDATERTLVAGPFRR